MRFALMCNEKVLSRWQSIVLSEINALPGVHLELIILNEDYHHCGIIDKIKRLRFNKFLYQIFITSFFRPKAELSEPFSDSLNKVPTINCRTIKKGPFSQYFTNEDVAYIKSKNLDFIIRFGFGIIRGEILNSARYGIWSFHHGDNQKYRGGPPGFWEIYHNDNVTGAVLQRLTDKLDAGIILKQGYYNTVKHYQNLVKDQF